MADLLDRSLSSSPLEKIPIMIGERLAAASPGPQIHPTLLWISFLTLVHDDLRWCWTCLGKLISSRAWNKRKFSSWRSTKKCIVNKKVVTPYLLKLPGKCTEKLISGSDGDSSPFWGFWTADYLYHRSWQEAEMKHQLRSVTVSKCISLGEIWRCDAKILPKSCKTFPQLSSMLLVEYCFSQCYLLNSFRVKRKWHCMRMELVSMCYIYSWCPFLAS